MSFDPATPTIDELRALPVPEFAERDTAVIKQALVSDFERISGRTLYPAQPEMFMIELMSYALSNVGSGVQNGLMQNRAIWAEGTHLDELGANVGTFRLSAQYARAEVEFTLSEPRNSGVVIPVGTRVAAGSALIFRTVQELVIPAGSLSGIVDTMATETGAAHNDLQLAQVQDILDPVAYVSAVTNVQISAGGSDAEADDRFRERIVNAFERITRGGSRAGYIELVLGAHPDIVDVEVIRPQPGHIHIYPLMNSGIAADAIDDVISEYLDPETKIPMGDFVTIQKVSAQVFDVVMTLKVAPGYAAGAVAQAEDAIRAQFAVWSQTLGAQVAPSALVETVRGVAGVVGVDGPTFAFTDLTSTQFASLGVLTVNLVETPNV
jgi:phage-related baseplate assembly protein